MKDKPMIDRITEPGYVCFKETALNLSKHISALFEEKSTPILFLNNQLQFESDKLRVTIIFEELE